MKLACDTRGAVALEYILTLTLAIPFFVAWLALFEPGVGYTTGNRTFMGVKFGNGMDFVQYYQRILVGISLPIP